MFRFYAVPAWHLLEDKQAKAEATTTEVELRPTEGVPEVMEAALAQVEYRDAWAADRARELLATSDPAIYARSPNDLPALLRTADQLQARSRVVAGERATVWRCSCGTRFVVPVSLVRPLNAKCEKCGKTADLGPGIKPDPAQVTTEVFSVNATRRSLSEFFREAMARGWPVLVTKA